MRSFDTPWSEVAVDKAAPMPLRALPDPDNLPALDRAYVRERPALGLGPLDPAPRILLLYGSLRERSFSRLAVEEAARLLRLLGAEARIFDPSTLPLPDQVQGDDHPAVRELRELSMWSEGQVWCSPERHGQITGKRPVTSVGRGSSRPAVCLITAAGKGATISTRGAASGRSGDCAAHVQS